MSKNKFAILLLAGIMLFSSTSCKSEKPADFKSETNPFGHFMFAETSRGKLLETIEILSSPEFDGRLSGTVGNEKATEYVSERFRKLKLLSPEGLVRHRQTFTQKTLITEAPSELFIYNEDGSVRNEFVDISDFKAITYWKTLKINGTAEGKFIYIDSLSDLSRSKSDSFNGNILLFDESIIESSGNVFAFISRYNHIVSNANGWIFDWDIRSQGYFPVSRRAQGSSPFDDSSGPVAFLAGEETFDSLTEAARDGLSGRMTCRINFADVESSNVIGYIAGSNPQETLVISAHLDHVGNNMNGTYNPGALDNASGVSVMLETAGIVSNGLAPVPNIVFIAFNGEEEGLWGSLHYASNPCFPLENSVVLNLDMVGSGSASKTTISGKNSELAEALIACFEEAGIEAAPAENAASDHTPLLEKGANAVLINEDGTDMLHRPTDTLENAIDPERLLRVQKSILYYIDRTAY